MLDLLTKITEIVTGLGMTGLGALDDALAALSKVDPRKGRVVELRYFGGLRVEETAEVLQISAETVTRDWQMAKSWLFRELTRTAKSRPRTGTTHTTG